MSLLVKKNAHGSKRVELTPQYSGLTHVGFAAHQQQAGTSHTHHSPSCESCLVILAGQAQVWVDDHDLGVLGARAHVFEDKSPDAVYVGRGQTLKVQAHNDCEIAISTAPATQDRPYKVIHSAEMTRSVRGQGSNTRYICDILPQTDPTAESLLVVEVITPAGHSSSYPPHKHDRDAAPEETLLEETYYHRLNPPQGFAFQRVYTDDRSIDEAMAVEDHDVVMVPRGYHPCVAPHGYDLYYLNTMAGPKRQWHFANDPAHEWMLK